MAFPRLPLDSIDDNVMLRVHWAHLPIEHAFALMAYRHDSPYHLLLMRIKYEGDTSLALRLGQWVGEEDGDGRTYRRACACASHGPTHA